MSSCMTGLMRSNYLRCTAAIAAALLVVTLPACGGNDDDLALTTPVALPPRRSRCRR
jgi:hypothetical protein